MKFFPKHFLLLVQAPVRALAVALLYTSQIAAADAETTEMQLQLVEQRISSLQQQGETSEDSATLKAYQATLNLLHETEKYEQLAAQLQNEQSTAAEEEADIRTRINAAYSSQPHPDLSAMQKLDWSALNNEANDLRNSLQSLINKRDSLDQQLAAESSNVETIRARLSAIDAEEARLPESHARFDMSGMATQFEASQWQLAAQHSALGAERRALNAQLTNQPARGRVRRAQRDELVRDIESLQQDLNQVDQLQASKRPAQTDEVLKQATPGTPAFVLLQQLARENAQLSEHRTLMTSELNRADAEKTRTDGKLFELMDQFNSARRLVDSGGTASVYGPFLMSYYMSLDQYRPPANKLRQSNAIGEIVIDRAQHEQELSQLLDSRQFINHQLEALGISEDRAAELLETAKPLIQERNNLLSEVMSSETKLVQLLGRIDISYEQLDTLVAEFKSFLIGHILWVRSHLPLDRNFYQQVLLDWHQAKDSLRASMTFSGRSLVFICLLTGLALLLLRRRMWQQMERINTRIGRPRDDSILFSLETLVLTLLRSAAVPLIMASMAISIDNSQRGLLQPLALALLLSAASVMIALFLRDATAAGGICRAHFGWPENRCKAVSSLMSWALLNLMPMVIVSSFLVHLEQNSPHAVLGRLALCIVAIPVAMRLRRMLLRQRLSQPIKGIPGWLQDSLVIGLTVVLIAIVLSGFLLPARIIYYSVAITALTLVCLVFLHELLMRWLLVTRRRIRFQQLVANLPDSADEEKADSEARQTSLGDLSDSTAQLIKSLIYASAVLSIILIWTPLLPAIQGLQRFSLWKVTQTVNGEQLHTQITLATVVLAILVIVITIYAARRIPALLELIMRSSGRSSAATRYTVTTLINYVIIAIGILMFFSTLKMSWSQLQWLVAAMGVGIGFGLQEIVANFISGLIILFEQPIRVGDVVTIGESSGTVTRIRIRATTIRDWDGKELLVPNKEFITGRLLNWTLSDTNIRITLDVGVAYGTDITEAMHILDKVVTSHPAVLKEPPPNILFTQFGSSALQLSARCFFADLEDRQQRVSELNQQIYAAFNAAGIVISYPQLDVHLDPDSPLTVRLQGEIEPAPRT